MKLVVIAAALALLAAGAWLIWRAMGPGGGFADDGYDGDMSSAVLEHLYGRIPSIGGLDAEWAGGEDGADQLRARISAGRADIARLREWARTLPDRRQRAAYERWFAYYEHGYREAESELRTHARRDAFKAWERADAAARRRQNDLAGKIAKPPER